jgi:hypothetical protein
MDIVYLRETFQQFIFNNSRNLSQPTIYLLADTRDIYINDINDMSLKQLLKKVIDAAEFHPLTPEFCVQLTKSIARP